MGEEAKSSPCIGWPQTCSHSTLHEIQLATQNFDESLVIGRGGFGKVYKGTIINGASHMVAAIKRFESTSNQGAVEFWTEVEMLSKLRHCYLVSLIGYCNDGKEMILVYEYMPHGTLEDHLHKLPVPLPWMMRLKICIGAARGLDYLHTGTGISHGVIHRDVKSSNILLDKNWAAEISDFGLSKIGPTNQPSTHVDTLVKGTFGYLDPDYFFTSRLTRKSDVYAFGVILFENLCVKRAVDCSIDEDQCGLARWAQDSIKEGRLKLIVDSNTRGEISPKCLKEFARLADSCLHSHPKQRPTMAKVVATLESILTLQERTNNTMHLDGRTIFGRKVPMFLLPSNRTENSAADRCASVSGNPRTITQPSSSIGTSNSTSNGVGISPNGEALPMADLKVYSYSDSKTSTRNYRPDMVLGIGGFGTVYKGWVEEKTMMPSKPGTGTMVAIKKLNHESFQGFEE